MTRDEERANQAAAPELLKAAREAWCEAHDACETAKRKYYQRARSLGIRLCSHCEKPMPEYDHSMQCDGCHLPWGWNTPEGRKLQRTAELDAQIERLRKEREALG